MDKLQQVRDFLEKTAKERGISLNSLSLKIGKNSTYLFHFIKRHSPKRLDETSRRQLAHILQVDEQSLCDFQLPSSLFQDKLSSISNILNFSRDKNSGLVAVDVIDMKGSHRGRFEAIKNNIIGQEFMTPEVFAIYSSSAPKQIKIIKAAGEAMSPTINPEDMVWIDTSYKTPSSDGIYLVNTASDAIFRRIQLNPFDNSVELSADNPAYKNFSLNEDASLDICGKVLFVLKKLT